MADSNVVGMGEYRNPVLVSRLEDMLAEAKSGVLTSFTGISIRSNMVCYEIDSNDLTNLNCIGSIEVLKQMLIDTILASDEPEE